MRYRFHVEDTYDDQRLVVLAMKGPGYEAKGCQGETRWATVTRARVNPYAKPVSTEALRAMFDSAEEPRKR